MEQKISLTISPTKILRETMNASGNKSILILDSLTNVEALITKFAEVYY